MDVRVVVVGERIFPVAIHPLSEAARMDFSVDRNGRYYFLEANPAGGQYGWLEAKTGVRLTEAVADLLAQNGIGSS